MSIATNVEGKSRNQPRGEFRAMFDFINAGRTDLTVRYELTGPQDARLLIVAGGISAGRHTLANESDNTIGWWEAQSHALRPYRVLSIDWLGAHGELDRVIDAADQARAILATLDHLQLFEPAAFVGASYGAMVGMHCSAIAPERVCGLLSISAAHRSHSFTSAQRAIQRQAVELGERLGSPEAGVALARKLAILTYRTPEEFAGRFTARPSVQAGRVRACSEDYLDHMGEKHSARTCAIAYRRLSESIDLHSINPATIRVPATFVAVESDQLIPASDIKALAEAVADSRLITIRSLFGHDAFLKEERAIANVLDDFLNSLEQVQ